MAVVNFTLFCLPINFVTFYKKNNQGKQDIFTAIELFSNDSGKNGKKMGEMAKVVNIFFEKSGPLFCWMVVRGSRS